MPKILPAEGTTSSSGVPERAHRCGGRPADQPADDGTRIIYVNAEYADADTTEIGALMRDFMNSDPSQIKNAVLRERMNYLKNSGEGNEEMCQVMEELIHEEKRRDVQKMLKMGVGKDFIMEALSLTEEQYEEFATPLAG
ncbi:MAG: hypothetical protein IJ233_07515 [Pyramidobacter sp.]|nr:hypothetical protein [Pyramidobacter sp.]